MKNRKHIILISLLFLTLLIGACSPAPEIKASYDRESLKFNGKQAFEIESQFVTQFTNRHSGTKQNQLAVEWLLEQFTASGWICYIDEWTIVNYSQKVPLRNLVCELPGDSDEEILAVAHHDQASTTVEGADNDGSGIAILLHLAEIFAREAPLPYKLVFVATDAEEYGMIGSNRYIQTHPNIDDIIAGMSLDNLGRYYYDGMNMELIGQFQGYGPIWLALTAREAAAAGEGLWTVHLRAPLDQALDQAAPISFMDQGPMVAAGVPAMGLAASLPPEFGDEHHHLWHDPDDTMEYQSPEAVGNSGLVAEALIRQLLSMDEFPQESGPYLYFDEKSQVLRGPWLYLIFILFLGVFFAGGMFIDRTSWMHKLRHWRVVLPHFLGLWLPLVAVVLLLYLFPEIGLMLKFHVYPATTKDPELLNPRWPAIFFFLASLAIFMYIGRKAVWGLGEDKPKPEFTYIKSFAFLVIALAGIYVLIVNPFSLLFFVPLLFWFLITGRHGAATILDIFFFLLGGLVVYALIYFFGFVILRTNFAFLWMFMYMFVTGMIGFPTALVSTAILAAGLSMLVTPSGIEEI